MNELPRDPFMLLSFVNMKLRDHYPDLDTLCRDMDVDKDALLSTIGSIGMEYNPETNKFW